jgi:hypothetical protein
MYVPTTFPPQTNQRARWAGGKCFEKVETLAAVRARHIPIDRSYYLKSLRVPMDNIFLPIVRQRIALASPALGEAEVRSRSVHEAQVLLWNIIRGRRLTQTKTKQQACLAASPLAMAFARQSAANASANAAPNKRKAEGAPL